MNQKESEGISRALELASRVDEMVLGVHQLAAASAACLARVQHEAALPLGGEGQEAAPGPGGVARAANCEALGSLPVVLRCTTQSVVPTADR